MFGNEAVRGGGPWGAGTLAGPDGSRQPTEQELEQALWQVRLLELTLLLGSCIALGACACTEGRAATWCLHVAPRAFAGHVARDGELPAVLCMMGLQLPVASTCEQCVQTVRCAAVGYAAVLVAG